ncbi:MAG: DUF2277 family protein [Actinomycetota bacterium]
MCRSIERLRTPTGTADREAIEAAARQFIRKVSGFRNPPSAAPDAFEEAIRQVADSTSELLGQLPPLKTR